MKKIFPPFLICPDNSIDNVFSIMSTPLNLNNIDDFSSFQNNTFIQKNNQFSDYEEEIEEEDDFDFITKNCITNNEELTNFINIFSFDSDSKGTFKHIDMENSKNKEGEISLKKCVMENFSGENNNEKNNEKLNSINSKDHISKDNKNNCNNNNIDFIGNPIVKINNNNEISKNIVNKNNTNKKLEKEKLKWKNLEIDYANKFQLFSKGANNSYIHEIINSINNLINNKKINKKKKPKKIFKINNIENGDDIKLIGKKKKRKKRCEKPDDIRKKLKSRFHKIFTKKINDNLKAANSEKIFYSMPQIFISNIAKRQNKEVMNMKMKDLLGKNFVEDYKGYKVKNMKSNNDKYLKNLNTLNYIENNIDIQEKSKFNIIGEMKYFEILDEFFYSKEFEDTVIAESKIKSAEYIKDYVNKARTYVKFFLNSKSS